MNDKPSTRQMIEILPKDSGSDLLMLLVMFSVAYIFYNTLSSRHNVYDDDDDDDDEYNFNSEII